MTDPETTLRAAVDAIRTWSRGDERAPHKPLLLLYALGRVQRGEPRLVPFLEVEEPLTQLLREFGPTRRSLHPSYPFWRMQRDGLWDVPGGEALRARQSNTDPPVSELRRASGGFPPEIDTVLRTNPALVTQIAEAVLRDHFPASVHQDVLSAVGLDIEVSRMVRARSRDPKFREAVLRAYLYRCAVCGLDAHLDGMSVGLEAAHVHWHCHAGPDAVENGLSLCALHHKALDMGLIGLSSANDVAVSSRLHGGEAVEAQLGRFHGRALVGPFHGHAPIAASFASWHRREVFKEPARSV